MATCLIYLGDLIVNRLQKYFYQGGIKSYFNPAGFILNRLPCWLNNTRICLTFEKEMCYKIGVNWIDFIVETQRFVSLIIEVIDHANRKYCA